MPNRGDTLYHCWNAQLEKVRFIEENIAEGASVPTWVVREVTTDRTIGRRMRISANSFFATEQEAWQAELAQYETGLQSQIEQLEELRSGISRTRATIVELRKKATMQPTAFWPVNAE